MQQFDLFQRFSYVPRAPPPPPIHPLPPPNWQQGVVHLDPIQQPLPHPLPPVHWDHGVVFLDPTGPRQPPPPPPPPLPLHPLPPPDWLLGVGYVDLQDDQQRFLDMQYRLVEEMERQEAARRIEYQERLDAMRVDLDAPPRADVKLGDVIDFPPSPGPDGKQAHLRETLIKAIPKLARMYPPSQEEALLPDYPCVVRHFLGTRDKVCRWCDALMWTAERVKNSAKSRPAFGRCCQHGKVKLPPLSPTPAVLADLLLGRINLHLWRDFVENIRKYNNAFAMTSVGVDVKSPAQGMFFFLAYL